MAGRWWITSRFGFFWFGPGKTGSSYLGMEALTEGGRGLM